MADGYDDVLKVKNPAAGPAGRRQRKDGAERKPTFRELTISAAAADENLNSSSPYKHSVYSTISLINGAINRMDLSEMKRVCKENHLNSFGKREAVKRRLKEYFKTEKLIEAGLMERKARDVRNADFFVVVDFEATCEEKNPQNYPHEIIEFPAILLSTAEQDVVDVFHSFVRPVINPKLSDFCRSLTGIGQSVIDAADPFPVVHERFVAWLESHQLGTKHTFTVVTDGPFDVGRFLYLQVKQCGMAFPFSYAGHWANIRKCFANFYKDDFYATNAKGNGGGKPPGLKAMLDCLGLEFEGSPHSGLDDATNIARILVKLLEDRAFVRVNEKIVNVSDDDKDGRGVGRLANVMPVSRKDAEKLLTQRKKQLIR